MIPRRFGDAIRGKCVKFICLNGFESYWRCLCGLGEIYIFCKVEDTLVIETQSSAGRTFTAAAGEFIFIHVHVGINYGNNYGAVLANDSVVDPASMRSIPPTISIYRHIKGDG